MFVRDIPVEEAIEIYDLRAAMDELVGRRLRRIDHARAARRRARALVDADGAGRARRGRRRLPPAQPAVPRPLVELAGNRKLATIYRKLVKELRLFRRLNLADSSAAADLRRASTAQIVKAIAAGDAEAAGRAMFEHVMDSRSNARIAGDSDRHNEQRRRVHAPARKG